MFQRPFRGKGYIPLSTYLTQFKVGDYVDIKVNGAVHKVRAGPAGWVGDSSSTGGPAAQQQRLAPSCKKEG